MTLRGTFQFAVLFLACSIFAADKRGTIVEFSADKPPLPDLSVGTCKYGPTKIEKKFYERLTKAARVTLQAKPGEFNDANYHFKLAGHEGKFVSWFGIVRDIIRNPEGGGGTLLIENKYGDDLTDCHIQTVQIYGAGDFEAELSTIPNDLIPLVLVRVYGVVKREQNNRPVIKADYVRVWHWGQFNFMDFGEDHGNPEWKKRMGMHSGESIYAFGGSGGYYRERLGPTTEQLEQLKKFYQHETIIEIPQDHLEAQGTTAVYAPTKTEKPYFDRLSDDDRVTVYPKAGEWVPWKFQLRGQIGEFVSWFGIVREITSPVGKRGGHATCRK